MFTRKRLFSLLADTFRHAHGSNPSRLGADDAGGSAIPSFNASIQKVLGHLGVTLNHPPDTLLLQSVSLLSILLFSVFFEPMQRWKS